MTNLDLINWTIEEAARVRTERGGAGNSERRQTLDKLLAELERGPADPVKAPGPPALRGDIVLVDPAPPRNAIPAEIETASNVLAASAERFAALERRYAAHLALSIRAPVDTPTFTPATPPPADDAAPQPALLRAIVKPGIHTERADRDRAVNLRWVLRDIRNRRLQCSSEVQNDLEILIGFKLVEMRDGEPILTNAGLRAIA
jgi:hypothetical protein